MKLCLCLRNFFRFLYCPAMAILFYHSFYIVNFYFFPPIIHQKASFFSDLRFSSIYHQFPFQVNKTIKKQILLFINQLEKLKSNAPINPYTGRHVFIAAVVNLKQYDLAMNLLCSFSQVQVDPKSLLLITIDKESYMIYKRYNIPICLLDLSSCRFEYYILVKVKIIILKILLLLDYELLVTDIDIAYFEPFKQYLFLPETYDIGLWYEAGIPDVTSRTFYWNINTGFLRMFPTTSTINLLNEWIKENNENLKIGNQRPLQELMRNNSKTNCTYIDQDDQFFLKFENFSDPNTNPYFYKGFWRCTIYNKTSFIWHIFPERKMLSGCEAVTRNLPSVVDYRKKNISAGMLHLICVSGGDDKGRFLNSSGLWFYDTKIKQCIRESAIKRWKVIFTKFNESFFVTPYRPTLYSFPTIHIVANFSKYTIVDDVNNWASIE